MLGVTLASWTRALTIEKTLKKWEDRMNYLPIWWWMTASPCPCPPRACTTSPAWNGHGGRNGDYEWGQQHALPLTKPVPRFVTAADECPTCQRWTLRAGPRCGAILQGDGLEISWQVDYIGLFSYWRGQLFTLTTPDTHSGCGFAFPVLSVYAVTTTIILRSWGR